MSNEIDDLKAFHRKFGFLEFDSPAPLTRQKLDERYECMQEELDEFYEAVMSKDFAAQADALIDLVYFVKGTAIMLGLPWDELWNDVQRANMEKIRGVGHRGHLEDCIKPDGWQGPNTKEILKQNGFTGKEKERP